ncbi:MatE family protein [Tritrichomonas foetus]|uniref:MatE family protein n=1 Tax=Tritrichomonas foetus TaxID=1144522 RepID=A0A1J4J7V4_9EUKA|nr:MatE family protein [Tritrichomonas foetus]|eukprot:OHS95282.1 MatE family protein [Tritrichomonas foetus]
MDKELEVPLTAENPLGDIHEPVKSLNIDINDSKKNNNSSILHQRDEDRKIMNNHQKIENNDEFIDSSTLNHDSENVEKVYTKNDKSNHSEENYRLAGRPPLKTLVILAIGPLISQFVSSMYGVVASMWVARAVGDIGMAAVSMFTNLDNIGRAFGFFMNCSASQKISSLYGQKKGDETGQVICDLFRCSILSGMFVPAVLLPCAKPLGRWFGSDEITLNMGYQYLSLLLGCSTISCFFLMFCGCLQAEGRTILVSVAQISSFVMNMGIFCPLFLLVFKMGTRGAALATVCSEAIPSLVLGILYFYGKFSSKPKLSGLFKKFSPHTWPALGVGVSQLAANCSRSLPSILQRKFMGMITQHTEGMSFNDAMAGFNAVIRICGLTDSFRFALSMALLPTSSYAIAAGMYDRFLYLNIHGCWLNVIWGVATCLITSFIPKYVAMMISSSEPYLAAAAPIIRNANFEAPFAWCRYICQTILQALSCGMLATIYSVISSFVLNIAVYCLLYYTDKTNVPRMMYAYAISSSIAFVIGVLMLIKPIKEVYRKAKEEKNNKSNNELISPLNPDDSKEAFIDINANSLEIKNVKNKDCDQNSSDNLDDINSSVSENDDIDQP